MAGGRGGGRGPMPREVQVSKKLSWLLRHGAEKEGLQLGQGGYISMKDVLNNRNLKSLKVTFDEVKQIVAENDKQRFSLIHKSALPSSSDPSSKEAEAQPPASTAQLDSSTPTDPPDFYIRANQGHSLALSSESLLTPITPDTIPSSTIVHGTTHAAWVSIVASGGLMKMGRNHIHFASGLPAHFKPLSSENPLAPPSTGATEDAAAQQQEKDQPVVISGMRSTSSILIFLDLASAMRDGGHKFWLSANGVVLSEGNEEQGLIGLKYFSRVEDRTGGLGVLVQDGVVVREAPEAWARSKAKSGGARRRGGGKKGGDEGTAAAVVREQSEALDGAEARKIETTAQSSEDTGN
ncbi:hypothetical protein AAFC00_004585 [Neodothiora populina]|uniref:2'-phosphotransferase n=1 Tax=Neodothiora populina TaxID=2781224 RepID=A0ABR3P2U1_9PEZI